MRASSEEWLSNKDKEMKRRKPLRKFARPMRLHRGKKKSFKRARPKPVGRVKKRSRIRRHEVRGYKVIEDLHNIHKSKEIWILGTGPSLDDFPDDFFDEFDENGKQKRIAIAVMFAWVAFPKCKYYQFGIGIGPRNPFRLFQERGLPLKKCILNVSMKYRSRKIVTGTDPIYMDVHYLKGHSGDAGWDYYKNLAPSLLAGKRPEYGAKRYYCTGTLVHWSIQAAIIMGAKKVTCVGCEHRVRKFQNYALKHGLDKVYGPGGFSDASHLIPKEGFSEEHIKAGNRRVSMALAWYAKIMKPYGVQVARYYYGKGYEIPVVM